MGKSYTGSPGLREDSGVATSAILAPMRSIITPRFARAWIANFFSDLSFTLFVHFAGFLSGLGAGEAVIGATASVAAVTAIAVRPRTGSWMDQYGRIPIVRVAAVVRILATLSFLMVSSIGPLVFVIRAIHMTAVAVTFTGLITYASDAIPADRRSQAIAWYGLSGMVAGAIGPLLGDRLVASYGYSGIFIGMAAAEAALLVVLFSMRAIENRPKLHTPGGSLALITYRPLVPIWLMMVGFGLGFGTLLNFMRTFVDATGIGAVGPFFTAYAVAAIVTRLGLSSLPQRIGEMRVLYPAIAFYGAGIALLSITSTTTMLWIAAAVAGTGHAFMFPILGGLVVGRSPEDRRAGGMSLFSATFDLGPLIGAPIIGLIVERQGYGPMWIGLAATIVSVGLAFFVLDKKVVEELVPRPL